MARYIDAEALLEELRSLQVTITGIRVGKSYLSTIVREYQKSVLKIVHEQPTADVVPKSEVDELKQDLEIAKIAIENRNIKIEGMRTAANSYKMHYEKARGEVARQIFEEIDEIMANIEIYVSDRERTNFEIGAYKCHASISLKIAKLKKKYTGD